MVDINKNGAAYLAPIILSFSVLFFQMLGLAERVKGNKLICMKRYT